MGMLRRVGGGCNFGQDSKGTCQLEGRLAGEF